MGVDGNKWQLQNIHSSLKTLPANRTLLDDLKLLRQLGLVASGGRGVGARWWLVPFLVGIGTFNVAMAWNNATLFHAIAVWNP